MIDTRTRDLYEVHAADAGKATDLESTILHGNSEMWTQVDELADAMLRLMHTDGLLILEQNSALDVARAKAIEEALEHTGSLWFEMTLRIGHAMLNEDNTFRYDIGWESITPRSYGFTKIVGTDEFCTDWYEDRCTLCRELDDDN